MNYSVEDAKKATKYMESGMAPATVAMIMNKSSDVKYTADDIMLMVSDLKKNPPPSGNGRLYDIAAGIVFNPDKRSKIKIWILSILILFAISMVALGVLVSWTPVLITVGSIVGLILIMVVAIVVMAKTGFLERMIDRYDR